MSTISARLHAATIGLLVLSVVAGSVGGELVAPLETGRSDTTSPTHRVNGERTRALPGAAPRATESDPGHSTTAGQRAAIIGERAIHDRVDDMPSQGNTDPQNPPVTISDPDSDDRVRPGNLTVMGTSNREDGTTIYVEVLEADGDVVVSTETRVNGSTSTWAARLDLSRVQPGNYTIRASDSQVSAEKRIRIVEANISSTPTEQELRSASSPTPQVVTIRRVEIETKILTRVVSPGPTASPGGQPGWPAVMAVLAIIVAALLAVR